MLTYFIVLLRNRALGLSLCIVENGVQGARDGVGLEL